jgi:dimeric dUTPase (all-alpha-NTP-PPase superfamily)
MSKEYYEENDRRMNIIGQNGNDGLHYDKVVENNEENRDKLAHAVVDAMDTEALIAVALGHVEYSIKQSDDTFHKLWSAYIGDKDIDNE